MSAPESRRMDKLGCSLTHSCRCWRNRGLHGPSSVKRIVGAQGRASLSRCPKILNHTRANLHRLASRFHDLIIRLLSFTHSKQEGILCSAQAGTKIFHHHLYLKPSHLKPQQRPQPAAPAPGHHPAAAARASSASAPPQSSSNYPPCH